MALDQVAATDASSGAARTGAAATSPTTSATGGMTFRSVLSDINPLQYVPVVGAVYRAITGDEGNSTLRFAASLGTSFAMGGPVGLGITVAEKITGFDPERIARALLSRVLHHGTATPGTTGGTAAGDAAASGTTAGGQAMADAGGTAADRPWSAAELSAYAAANGSVMGAAAGASVGADTLNAMELQRVRTLYA